MRGGITLRLPGVSAAADHAASRPTTTADRDVAGDLRSLSLVDCQAHRFDVGGGHVAHT